MKWKAAWSIVAVAVLASAAGAAAPSTISFAGDDLARVKTSLAAGESAHAEQVARLRRDAEEVVSAGPFSVMQKKAVGPSGDKHDYVSMAPYWWPDPSKPDGKPYVRRDGEYNPERAEYDLDAMDSMSDNAQTLALAYYFTGESKYADRAALLMRTWFLDAATKMNPNVRYAQFRPGSDQVGVPFGVLETTRLFRVLDADALLAGSTAWSESDHAALRKWFTEYLDYLRASPQGKAEHDSENNHGTWYAVQVASYLIYLDRSDEAKAFIEERGKHFIDEHLAADGSQPLELGRTRPLHYSRFNLRGLMELARLGDRVGVDLWSYKSPKGASIQMALDWLTPKFLEPEKSGLKDIGTLKPRDLYPLFRWASQKYNDPPYEAAIASLKDVKLNAERAELLFPRSK